MARAVMPMLSASCGRTRITAGVSPMLDGGAPVRPARRTPKRSLRRTRRAQNQYSSPAQVLARCSRLGAVSVAVPVPVRRMGELGEGDLGVARDELVEGRDAQRLGPALAAGTRGLVRLAAPLGAVGEDRLEAVAVEAGHGKVGKAGVDGPLVAGMDDGRDGQPGAGKDRLAILDGDCGTFDSLCRPSDIHAGGHTGACPRYPANQERRVFAAGSRPRLRPG